MQYFVKLLFFVRRTIRVGKGTEFLQRKTCFAKAACRSMTDEIAENGKSAPQGKGFEGKDYLHICFVGHTLDELQIAAKQLLLKKVIGTHG